MTVYEQQAQALKEIAAELKGIRAVLKDIDKKLDTRAAVMYVDDPSVLKCDQADEQKTAYICGTDGFPCTSCTQGPCEHRREAGADNG